MGAIAAAAACTLPLYEAYGLTIAWPTALPNAAMLALLLAVRRYYVRRRRDPVDWCIAEMLLALTCMLAATNVLGPAQYLATAFRRPLIDPWLAAADAALGIHVPSLAAWTAAHPLLNGILTFAYYSLLPQFTLVALLLGLVFRDRRRLWEYCFHFIACAMCTVAALALFPAECAFLYYGFESTLSQSRFIAHFTGARAGTFTLLDFRDLEGLISMPSFHVAGALMSTWALRGHTRTCLGFAVINLLLIAATFMSGAHYFIDVIATVVLFASSLLAYRLLSRSSCEAWGVGAAEALVAAPSSLQSSAMPR